MDASELTSGLANFCGSETWYRHPINRDLLYTDGAQFFAENAGGGAYWFLDIVATEIFQLQKKEQFLHIRLIAKGHKATIKVDDGNGVIVWDKEIEFTDCPDGEWRFYLTDNVLMWPSEY